MAFFNNMFGLPSSNEVGLEFSRMGGPDRPSKDRTMGYSPPKSKS